jgi:hypothetical protein
MKMITNIDVPRCVILHKNLLSLPRSIHFLHCFLESTHSSSSLCCKTNRDKHSAMMSDAARWNSYYPHTYDPESAKTHPPSEVKYKKGKLSP